MSGGDFCTSPRAIAPGQADHLLRPGVRIPKSALAKMVGRPISEIQILPSFNQNAALMAPPEFEPEPSDELLKARKRTPEKDRDTGIKNLPTRVLRVLDRLARHHGVTVDEITGRSRVAFFVEIRHEAFHELNKTVSLYHLAQLFQRDHTSIMHGVRRHAARLAREAAE